MALDKADDEAATKDTTKGGKRTKRAYKTTAKKTHIKNKGKRNTKKGGHKRTIKRSKLQKRPRRSIKKQ